MKCKKKKKKKIEWWIIGERNGRGRGNNAGEFGRKEGLMGFNGVFFLSFDKHFIKCIIQGECSSCIS